MTHDNDPDLELHFSLGEVKNALGEIREKLDDIHMGEVHYRHSGNTSVVLFTVCNCVKTFFFKHSCYPNCVPAQKCVGVS